MDWNINDYIYTLVERRWLWGLYLRHACTGWNETKVTHAPTRAELDDFTLSSENVLLAFDHSFKNYRKKRPTLNQTQVFHLRPSVKYDFHWTDFHETPDFPTPLCWKLIHWISPTSVKKYWTCEYKFTAAVNLSKRGSPTRGPPGCITRSADYVSYCNKITQPFRRLGILLLLLLIIIIIILLAARKPAHNNGCGPFAIKGWTPTHQSLVITVCTTTFNTEN
jgi:hypothetical protein